MKKSILTYIIVTVFIFFNIIYYSLNNTNLYYEESKLTSSSTNDKMKEEIYEYIKMFDKNVIESLQVYENEPYKLNKEQMIDISVKYIISNEDIFQNRIKCFEDSYIYEKDGTIYYSKGYVDVTFFNEILIKLFATSDIDVKDSIYFDEKKGMVPLILMYGDVTPYIKEEIIDFEEIDYYHYSLTLKYNISDTCAFKLKYFIERNEFSKYGKYKLLGVTINEFTGDVKYE
ncbi:MAG: hypothetical protein Q4D02_04740 [Clostridia bacterium]|nr:hypothetical protein [Clostridia bacterium]